MPLFYFICSKCFASIRKILTVEQSKKTQFCPYCNYAMYREPKGPTPHAKEILDNGLMPRAVERPSGAEELYKNRAKEVEEARAKKE